MKKLSAINSLRSWTNPPTNASLKSSPCNVHTTCYASVSRMMLWMPKAIVAFSPSMPAISSICRGLLTNGICPDPDWITSPLTFADYISPASIFVRSLKAPSTFSFSVPFEGLSHLLVRRLVLVSSAWRFLISMACHQHNLARLSADLPISSSLTKLCSCHKLFSRSNARNWDSSIASSDPTISFALQQSASFPRKSSSPTLLHSTFTCLHLKNKCPPLLPLYYT